VVGNFGNLSPKYPLSAAIRQARDQGILPIIADIKPVSPRDGDLVGPRDVADLARMFVKAGACALSVVTEPTHFGGSLAALRRVCEAVEVLFSRRIFLFGQPSRGIPEAGCGSGALDSGDDP
jgi:indole-3-glycerol phosphate synthase